jgi:hypothetical protein
MLLAGFAAPFVSLISLSETTQQKLLSAAQPF